VDDEPGRCETAAIGDFELLHLHDGRRLEYCVSGPAGGPALLFHHGTPGGCTQFGGLADGAHRLGLRLVTSSRAGYGQSTRHPGRRIVDVTEDTERLLDSLGIGRCLVAGPGAHLEEGEEAPLDRVRPRAHARRALDARRLRDQLGREPTTTPVSREDPPPEMRAPLQSPGRQGAPPAKR
jgi:hypothetical protein